MRLILMFVFAAGLPAVEVLREDWFVGTLGGTPSATLHQRWERLPDGSRAVVGETVIVISRNLAGKSVRLEIRDRQRLVEDASGVLREGTFEHDEGAGPVVAVAQVNGGRLVGTVTALGRITPINEALPEGFLPRGDAWLQETLAKAVHGPVISGSLALISNRVVPVTTTAQPSGRDSDGTRRWSLLMDAAPVPMTIALDAKGGIRRMAMSLGPMTLTFVPSDGPVALVPADLSPAGLVKAAGPVPAARGSNRLILPPGVVLSDNPFQSPTADGVICRDQARPDVPRVEDSQPSSTCESDVPELVTWATAQISGITDPAEQAERLRSAVRSHITRKDLSVAEGTALQTFRNRAGDCSEHATLLAAALRATGHPARITVGLVYSPPHGGWVGHAWTEAWVAGTWVLLDAAYPGINRARYLALGTAADQGAAATLLATMARLLGQTVTVSR